MDKSFSECSSAVTRRPTELELADVTTSLAVEPMEKGQMLFSVFLIRCALRQTHHFYEEKRPRRLNMNRGGDFTACTRFLHAQGRQGDSHALLSPVYSTA